MLPYARCDPRRLPYHYSLGKVDFDGKSRSKYKCYPISVSEFGLVAEIKYGDNGSKEIKKTFRKIVEEDCASSEHLIVNLIEAGDPKRAWEYCFQIYFFTETMITDDLFDMFKTITIRSKTRYYNIFHPGQRELLPLIAVTQPKAAENKETGDTFAPYFDVIASKGTRRWRPVKYGFAYTFNFDFNPIPKELRENAKTVFSFRDNFYTSFWGDSNYNLFKELLKWGRAAVKVDAGIGEYFGGKKLFTLEHGPFFLQDRFRKIQVSNFVPTEETLALMEDYRLTLIFLKNITVTPDAIEKMLKRWTERSPSNRLLYLTLFDITEEVKMDVSGRHMRSLQLNKKSYEYIRILLTGGSVVVINGFEYILDEKSEDGWGMIGLPRIQLPSATSIP